MQVQLDERDIARIWRYVYGYFVSRGYGPDGAVEGADRHIASIRERVSGKVYAQPAPSTVPPTRTAEDERRDVLAYIRAELNRMDGQYASAYRHLLYLIDRAQHVGAADRSEVKP